jgi:hypothetical protein
MGESRLPPRDVGTTVVPIRPGIVVVQPPTDAAATPRPRHRWAICPVCSLRTLVNEFAVECACAIVMPEECYWGIVFGERRLLHVLKEFVAHYHERNHQGLGNDLIAPMPGAFGGTRNSLSRPVGRAVALLLPGGVSMG